MSLKSPQTLVGIVRFHVELWRQREGWTKETMASAIIDTHESLGGPQRTGIYFKPATQDIFIRERVNAERLYRWLDDETKEINLLPSNFLYSVLMAMPEHIRLNCMDDLLRPLKLEACGLSRTAEWEVNLRKNLRELICEDAKAHATYLAMVDFAGPLSIDDVLIELNESIETKLAVRHVLQSSLDSLERMNHFARVA